MVSPALQRGEKGFHKFVTESRRDGARTLFMQEPIKLIASTKTLRINNAVILSERSESKDLRLHFVFPTLTPSRCSSSPVWHATIGYPVGNSISGIRSSSPNPDLHIALSRTLKRPRTRIRFAPALAQVIRVDANRRAVRLFIRKIGNCRLAQHRRGH